MKKIIASVVLSVLSALLLQAQTENRFFTWAPYGHSLYADTHPDFCRLDVSSVSMNEVYDYGETGGPAQVHTFGTFGFNLPLFRSELSGGKCGFNLTLPLSAALWMDIRETVTSPIIDTDYRIAVPTLTFIHRFKDCAVKNYCIAINPFKHESTHIGDELVLQRSQKNYALKRVNVSYNYAEVKLTLNEPEDRMKMTNTFRLSVMIPVASRKGWYFVEQRDGDVSHIKSSSVMTNVCGNLEARGPVITFPETYFQYQWQSGVFSRASLQAVVSAEARVRARYGYNLSLKEGDQASPAVDIPSFNFNSFVGIRCNQGRDGYFSRSSIGFRAYYGICPYGMFRSIGGYSMLGLCIIFE